ncbi:MAG: hypothetical protein R2729_22300, partial [Bryobacteraceae bacterium]
MVHPGMQWEVADNGRGGRTRSIPKILGVVAPWQVGRVELKLAESEIHVYLKREDGAEWLCPECGKK